MKYEIKKGYIYAKSNGKLKGNEIKFPKISVGATEQLIMSAVFGKWHDNIKELCNWTGNKRLNKFS